MPGEDAKRSLKFERSRLIYRETDKESHKNKEGEYTLKILIELFKERKIAER